ncbi:neurofilament heavy polypeptide-like [Impatiens glandulifera]|uniref:neurofilament heavy polypeptide-like n=1 Tax=Impatiens glandulifera TaxID=253017 RepID=UPI001FB10976|nr:neurofilament heavy polypeptide-like [Impatiens glandulifera]
MLVGLIEGTKVKWAKEVFHNLKEMVKPDATRSWGYAIPLGKIFLHHNINTGPSVIISSGRLIRSKQFLERKQPAPGSTGGRKKTTARNRLRRKKKAGSKGKEKIVFSEPPPQTEEEESASTSERTESEKTDNEGPNDEEHSGPSPDNTGTGANSETVEGGEESTPRIDKSPTHGPTPPRANPATNETDEGTETPLTAQQQTEQTGASGPGITEDRVKILLQEFADSTVHPLEEKFNKTVSLALRFANNTRNTLLMTDDRISEIEAAHREEAVLRSNHLRRTAILEDMTSEIEKNFDRLERETEQRLTEVTEDLVGTTLDGVSELEKKNAGLEADLKALSPQVDELLKAKMNADAAVVEANSQAAKKVQDALDDEARREKEPPQLTEEERAERERRTEAKFPGLAKLVAAQAAKDAERLERERQRLEGFAAANKKKKEVPSSSVPAKRKRDSSKKAQVAELLNEVTDTVIESLPDQATHVEEEDEEHLEHRSTRQRVSESASRPQPVKRKRNKKLMASYDFSDTE